MNRNTKVHQAILVAAACFLVAVPVSAQTLVVPNQPAPTPYAGQIYWRAPEPGQLGFVGAVAELAQTMQDDRFLRERGVNRSVNFEYRSFRYERDFFNIYRGILLHTFLDGRVDLGLFNHKPNRQYFGRQAPYRPSSRYELLLRLHLQN